MEQPGRRFAFRLALALGFPHPDYLLSLLTSRQVAEWDAYYRVEPFGPPAEEHRAGVLAAVIGNFSSVSKRHDWKPTDFFPPQRKQQSLIDKVKAIFGVPRRR